MKQAVASLRTEGAGKTVMSGTGTPSYPLGIATGHQNPTERSFAFRLWGRSSGWRESLDAERPRVRFPPPPLNMGHVEMEYGVIREVDNTVTCAVRVRGVLPNTSPCATCPQRDDCGAKCQDYWNWYDR